MNKTRQHEEFVLHFLLLPSTTETITNEANEVNEAIDESTIKLLTCESLSITKFISFNIMRVSSNKKQFSYDCL